MKLGYHFTISWSPEEDIDNEKGFNIIREFCEEYFKENYEVVYSLHDDKDHCHGHIAFNSVNCKTGLKYRYEIGDWAKTIQPIVDKICVKYGLNTLSMDTGMSLEEYASEVKNKKVISYKKRENSKRKSHSNNKYYNEKTAEYSQGDYIKESVDNAIIESKDFNEFIHNLKKRGFDIKTGKYISVKGKGMQRYRRLHRLGSDYSEDAIKNRLIIKNEPLPKIPSIPDSKYCVPERYRLKVIRKKLSLAERRYYAKMFKQTIINKKHYMSYREINRNIKNIKLIEKKLELLNKYNIFDVKSTDESIFIETNKIKEIDSKRKDHYINKKKYKEVINLYKEIESFPYKEILDLDDNNIFRSEKIKYNELLNKFNSFGFKLYEVKEFIENMDKELKMLNKEKRELNSNLKLLNEVKNDIIKHSYEPYEEKDHIEKQNGNIQKKSKRI